MDRVHQQFMSLENIRYLSNKTNLPFLYVKREIENILPSLEYNYTSSTNFWDIVSYFNTVSIQHLKMQPLDMQSHESDIDEPFIKTMSYVETEPPKMDTSINKLPKIPMNLRVNTRLPMKSDKRKIKLRYL